MGFLHCSICPPYVEITKLWNTSLVPIQWAKPHDATKMPQLLCVKLEDPKKFTSQALRRSRSIIHLPAAPPGHSGAGRERVASVRRRSTACCGRCCVPRCSGMEPLQGFAGLGCHPCRTHAGLDYTTHRLRPDQQPRAGVTAGIPRRPKALPALLCVLWAPETPASDTTLAFFVGHMHRLGLSPTTARFYIAAVRRLHLQRDSAMTPGLPPLAAAAYQGYQARGVHSGPLRPRHALMPDLLDRLKSALLSGPLCVWDQRCVWAAVTLAFFCGLRASEYLLSAPGRGLR